MKKYFRSLLSAVHYCHEVQNISHRDIKPENIMLDNNGCVLLCDFGCSEFFTPSKGTLSKATKGTYLFMAPEMFSTDKATKVIKGRQNDIWAVGITLFNLLTKDHAFKGRGLPDLANSIKTKDPDLDLLGPGREELKSLLRRIFEKDPEKRMTV